MLQDVTRQFTSGKNNCVEMFEKSKYLQDTVKMFIKVNEDMNNICKLVTKKTQDLNTLRNNFFIKITIKIAVYDKFH